MEFFKEFIMSGAFNSTQSYLDGQPKYYSKFELDVPTLDLPTKRIESRVRAIHYTQNPITIVLDNSNWKVTKQQWDYLNSIGQKPEIGKLAQIETFLDGTIRSVSFV
jgi:hypothetical protein